MAALSGSSETPILTVRGLAKRYGGLRVLEGVDLQVRAGGCLGIMGANGAGKSTLFDIITGLVRADAGEILFSNHPLIGLACHQIARRGVARSHQAPRTMPSLSIRDSVALPAVAAARHSGPPWSLSARRLRAARALADSILAELSPDSLFPRRLESAGNCSFGEQKLIEILRAIAAAPRLLLLDEPVQGLNRAMADRVLAAILRLKSRGAAIIVIEHDRSGIERLADRILHLERGRVAGSS